MTCCCAVEGHYEWLRSPDEYLDNEMMLVDLDPGTTYQVRVVAKNGHGYEAAASWLTFHTPGVGQSVNSSRVIFMKHITNTRMWDNAQRDGRPAEHRWRHLFNAAKFC